MSIRPYGPGRSSAPSRRRRFEWDRRVGIGRAAIAAALLGTFLLSSGVAAQPSARPVGARPAAREPVELSIATERRPMPAWLKWGLVGAGAGAVTFAVLGRARIDREPNPVLHDAAVGAVTGFVIIGGAVAFYSWVCGPDSRSRRAGLCGR